MLARPPKACSARFRSRRRRSRSKVRKARARSSKHRGRRLEEASLHFSQGWAAMDVMAEAIRRTLDAGLELTGPNIRATLETFEDYETGGLLAPVSFSPEDHRANRALKIYQVENGIWVEASDLIDLRAME
ncbi:MAG: ABC transporter substrate-binding protein [Chloroflexi bacterium]|nr:ABC transporter substrate-binding protein [Chloroflexota bacterium]